MSEWGKGFWFGWLSATVGCIACEVVLRII